jgi:hypothetical protein
MQRSDRVSNIVLVVGMVCATIIILAFRERETRYVMQRTDGLADGKVITPKFGEAVA